MTQTQQQPYIDIKMNPDNLYREEVFTDSKVGAIRRMRPVYLDGSEDKTREVLFMGNTQLISPTGQPVPIQCPIEAKSLEEAIEKFSEAVNQTVAEIMTKAQEAHERQAQEKPAQEESSIIMPG